MWQGAGLVIIKLDTDRRVRFGTWARGTHKAPPRLPDLGELQAFLEAPAAMPEEDVRKVATLFGAFTPQTLKSFRVQYTRKTWLINYLVPDSSHIVEIDTPMGQVTLQGNRMSEAQQQLMVLQASPHVLEEEQ